MSTWHVRVSVREVMKTLRPPHPLAPSPSRGEGERASRAEPSARLKKTREAFDALARDYDDSEESNELLLRLRLQIWGVLTSIFPPRAHLLDLGCGTGIDAAFLAERGYRVLATDLSPEMTARARELADRAGVGEGVETRPLAIEHLAELETERFDGVYANRGPFNCVDDLETVAARCARLLPAGGLLVATVLGRICPWEILFYVRHGRWRRAILRLGREFVSVPLQGEEIPTRYFTPREFYAPFSTRFELAHYQSLGLFLPPTYLAPLARQHPRLSAVASRLDDALGGRSAFRDAGDLFLIVLRRRG